MLDTWYEHLQVPPESLDRTQEEWRRILKGTLCSERLTLAHIMLPSR
jgi:hypothetical protein